VNIYLINDDVIFDSAAGILKSISQPENDITLPTSAVSCLELLLVSQGEPVKKSTLLEGAWHQRGFFVSDNSLNQVIALLRKSFTQLHQDKNLIVTVPRVGYQFSYGGSVELLDKQRHEETLQRVSVGDAQKVTVAIPDSNCEQYRQSAQRNKLKLCLVTVLLLGTLGLLWDSQPFHRWVAEEQVFIREGFLINDVELYVSEKIIRDSTKIAQAKSLIHQNEAFNHLLENKKEMKKVYVEDAIEANAFSYFLCDSDIHRVRALCQNIIILQHQ